jgi:hypothetical protein
MATVVKALTELAAVAFVLAIVVNITQAPLLATAEGFSRASNNLALLAIALVLCFRNGRTPPGL